MITRVKIPKDIIDFMDHLKIDQIELIEIIWRCDLNGTISPFVVGKLIKATPKEPMKVIFRHPAIFPFKAFAN